MSHEHLSEIERATEVPGEYVATLIDGSSYEFTRADINGSFARLHLTHNILYRSTHHEDCRGPVGLDAITIPLDKVLWTAEPWAAELT